MFSIKHKLTLFKLLAQGVEHKVKEEELFLLVAKQGPAYLKSRAEQAAVEVKRNNSFAIAGLTAELFTENESKAFRKAVENGRLLAALRTFATYYEIRINRKTHFKRLWPYALMVIIGVIIAPLPEFYFSHKNWLTYLLQTCIPLIILFPIFWISDKPKVLIKSQFAQDLGIPKLLLKTPSISKTHINNEMGSFMESTGMLKLCGYSWREAIEKSVEKVSNPIIRHSLGVIVVRMQRRDTFADALKRCEYFPEEYIGILEAAEKANQVPGALIRFKANQIIKTEATASQEIKMPARVMTLTAGFLFIYALMQLYKLGGS